MVTKNKGFSMLLIVVIIAVSILLIGLGYYTYINKAVNPAMKTSQSDTNTSGKQLEADASSIQLEDVESSISDIDNDLKELK